MQTVKKPTYQELEAEIFHLRDRLKEFEKLLFGSKSERFVGIQNDESDQLSFDFEEEEKKEVPPTVTDWVKAYERTKKQQPKKPAVRRPLPAHLPREERVIEPEEDTSGMKRIGEEVTEELDYTPGTFMVIRYIRPKYVKPGITKHDDTILTACLPRRPIDKGIPSAGLLAHILISKFVDHLPYYRICQQFQRIDVEVKTSTINDWVAKCCVLLDAVYLLHCRRHFEADYLQADETTIKVLKIPLNAKKGKKNNKTGFLELFR